MKFFHSLFLYLLFFIPSVQAANIQLNVSANPVVLGDQITLTFTANGQPNGQPDFSVLAPYFDLRGQSQSHNIRTINGKTTQQISWLIKAYPTKSGKITIPSVSFGNDKSNSAELNVLDSAAQLPNAGNANNNVAPDIIVEAFAEPKSAYVQQQIIYVQRLYYAVRFSNNSTLSAPQLKSGKMDIEPLEEDKRFSEKRQGRTYQVIERRFAVFPVQSGKIEFAPTFFEGRLLGNNNAHYDPFGFGTGKTIRRYSPTVMVDVLPQNPSYTGQDWVPAKSIQLKQAWSVPQHKLKTGEPVTITLEMTAEGLRAEQLPNFSLNLPDHIKSYKDRATLSNDSVADGIIGKRQEKIVLVPSRSGSFDLDDIAITWWNTVTDQQAVTTLSIEPLTVKGENTIVQEPPNNRGSMNENEAIVERDSSVEMPETGATNSKSVQWKSDTLLQDINKNSWFYFSMLLLVLQVFTLFLLWKQSSSLSTYQKVTESESDVKTVKRSQIEKTLRYVCTQNKPKLLHNVILEWGRATLGVRKKSLKAIAAHLPPDLAKEMAAFDESLYAPNTSKFDCNALCQGLIGFKPESTGKHDAVKQRFALYPDA